MIKRATRHEGKTPLPEDHMPDDVKDKVLSARKELLDRHTNPYDHDHIVSGQVARQSPMPSAIEKGPTDMLKSLGIQAQNPIAGKHQIDKSQSLNMLTAQPDDSSLDTFKKSISKPGFRRKRGKGKDKS